MDELVSCLNSFDELLKYKANWIEMIGDCPNVEMRVKSDSPFWRTVSVRSLWRCQINIISGKARIVSPDNIRKANGSKNAMLEKIQRLTAPDFIKPGDVLGVSRNGLYEHYAIYMGEGRVIHYCGETRDFGGKVTIHEAPFSDFIKDSDTFFVVWFDDGRPVKIQKSTSFLFNSGVDFYNGTFQRKKRNVYSLEETMKRAKSRIGEADYNLATNNCEHFAMWCKTGVAESSQVSHILNYAIMSGEIAVESTALACVKK